MSLKTEFKSGKRVVFLWKGFILSGLGLLVSIALAGTLLAQDDQLNVYSSNIRLALEHQKDFGNLRKANRNLDRLLKKVQKEVVPKNRFDKLEALEALGTIGGILEDENFAYSKNRLLIVELNKDRKSRKWLDCDDFSSIYLAAAELLGLPLKPVYFPDHVFLRCELENGPPLYWESTMAFECSIEEYRQWTGVSFDDSYPIILKNNQLEAIQLSDLGVAWFYRKNFEKATEFFQRSLDTDAGLGTAYNNLGASLARQGKLQEALDLYQTAIDINPNNSTAFLNSGVAFYKMGDMNKSIEFFEEALKISPGYNSAGLYKYRILLAKGEPTKAVEFLKELREYR